MTVINTNIKSLQAQQALVANDRRLTDAMAQLSTGKRINSAKDDAAGLAIANRLNTQAIGLAQAMRNAGDGVSMLQTADGASEEITNMLQRMRELAVQSANGTNGAAERTALDTEFGELQAQIAQISDNTEWNGMKILNGEVSAVNFQVGAGSGQTVSFSFKDLDASGVGLYVSAGTDILTAGSAASAISAIDNALSSVDSFRSEIGAKMNRLVHAADNASNVMMNTSASRSRIVDADYAKATSELARSQIIREAATAMLSQANQMPRTVLALLR
jgi:flagellin